MKGSYDAKEALRDKLKKDMEAWEAKNGKVETTPIIRRITDNLGDVFVTDRQRCHHRANSKRIDGRMKRGQKAYRMQQEGIDVGEIAKKIGVSVVTCKQYIAKYRSKYVS